MQFQNTDGFKSFNKSNSLLSNNKSTTRFKENNSSPKKENDEDFLKRIYEENQDKIEKALIKKESTLKKSNLLILI